MCWAMYFMSNKVIDQIVTKHSACIIDIYMANKWRYDVIKYVSIKYD